MQGLRRVKGVTVTTMINGKGVDVVFKSPYRWRIYEGDRDVTKAFGFDPGKCVYEEDPRYAWFHEETKANEINCRLHV